MTATTGREPSAAPGSEGGGVRGSELLIAVTGALFALGVGLLALAVWVDLPGPLSAYGDPEADWPILVQGLLGLVSFGSWWWVNQRRGRSFTIVLLALSVATVVILASSSYLRCPEPGQSPVASVLTRVVGLLTNSYETDVFAQPQCDLDGPPLALQLARLLQLLVVLVAATTALRLLLRGQLDRVFVRFARHTYLVLGAEAPSPELLATLPAWARGTTRALVTPDPAAPWLGRVRADGWRVVTGDAEQAAFLRALLRRHRGRRHSLRGLAVLSPDSTAVQRQMHAVEQATDGLAFSAPVRALLRIDDAWQAEDWRRRYLARTDRWIVDTISENEVTAQLLVDDALARHAEALVLVGRSDLTFAVVAELAQRAREQPFSGGDPVTELVVVGADATRVLEEHALAQRGFGNDVGVAASAREGADVQQEVMELLAELRGAGSVPAVVFTGEVDAEDQRLATRLGALDPGLLVYSRRTEVAGLGETPLLAQVRAFGSTLATGGARPVDRWERLARLLHERYIRLHPDPANPARQPWDGGLSDFYRESNTRQLVTAFGAAMAVGRSWGAGEVADGGPSAEQLDQMARIEHESWRAHLEEHGWRLGERNDATKRHPDLVPWDALSPGGRAKAREGVESTLALLATLGYRSFDDPSGRWHRYRRRGEVTAVRRDAPWSWTTSDGQTLNAAAGDWQVTDETGTRSVEPATFERTHVHLDGDRWARVGVVEARRARPGEAVSTPEGPLTAGRDEWLLRGLSGEQWLVGDAHFERAYEPDRE